MKLKFWEKEDDSLDSLTTESKDSLTSDFGGPGLPSSADTLGSTPAREIQPKFGEYSGLEKTTVPTQENAKSYSKEDLLEAKIDAVKSKMEIIDHKLDIIITKLKNVY